MLNHVLFNLEVTPWKEAEPGVRTFSDILILEVLKDIDHAQAQDQSGTDDSTYADTFETLLKVRDRITGIQDYLVPDAIEKAFHWIGQRIGIMFKFTQYFMIKTVAANLGDAQVLLNKELDMMELGQFHIGTNPSHTQVAKDDPHAPMHNLSAKLAVDAVRQIGEKMLVVWNGEGSINEVLNVLDNIMRHPATTQWQDPIVESWAEQNRTEICRASTPSAVVESTFHALEEIDETLELIDQYLGDPKTVKVIETIDKYFEGSKASQSDDDGLLKSHIQTAQKTSKKQRSRAEKIKARWDVKYPKPSSCQPISSIAEPVIPEQHRYLIQSGDTLTKIANMHDTTVEALQELNGINDDKIYAGQYLLIPHP